MSTRKTITIELDGKSYTAEYSTKGGVVMVRAIGKDGSTETNSTNSGGSGVEVIARLLLREMVEAGHVLPD